MALKDRIKAARMAKGMTLDELAQRVGVKPPTIQRYESGAIKNIPDDRLELIAKALGTTQTELRELEDEVFGTIEDMPYDVNSSIKSLTETFLRRPALVQEEIISKLSKLDSTFSQNVNELLLDNGDINGFMKETGLPIAIVGKFMQGETVETTPSEAERISTFFKRNVVDMFFTPNISSDNHEPSAEELPANQALSQVEDPSFSTNEIPDTIADMLKQQLDLHSQFPNNTYLVLTELARYLYSHTDDVSAKKTETAIDIINDPRFPSILDKTIIKFHQKHPGAANTNTLASLIAKRIYKNSSMFIILCLRNAFPVKNLIAYLEGVLKLDQ